MLQSEVYFGNERQRTLHRNGGQKWKYDRYDVVKNMQRAELAMNRCPVEINRFYTQSSDVT
jgi:hypothetical protein